MGTSHVEALGSESNWEKFCFEIFLNFIWKYVQQNSRWRWCDYEETQVWAKEPRFYERSSIKLALKVIIFFGKFSLIPRRKLRISLESFLEIPLFLYFHRAIVYVCPPFIQDPFSKGSITSFCQRGGRLKPFKRDDMLPLNF